MTLCKKIGIGTALGAVALMLILPVTALQKEEPGQPEAGDVVAPRQLSEWILASDGSYMLIDVRGEDAFLDDGIKTAVSMPAASLDEATLRTLPKHRRLVVYGADEEASAEVWRAIKPLRDRVEILEGGFAGWSEHVLHPEAPADAAGEEAWQAYREHVAVANYFLGKTEVVPEQRERVVRPVLRPRPAAGASEGC